MSAVEAHLRELAGLELYGDEDYYIEKSTDFQRSMEMAANYIGQLERSVEKKEQRIAELEALFEPFLRNFLKLTETGGPTPQSPG